jgi:DNA polymerase-1
MEFPNLTENKLLAIDIETYDPDLKELGPGPRRTGYILGISLATFDKEWYFPLNHRDPTENINKNNFYLWLNDTVSKKELVGANVVYDLDFLQYQNFIPRDKILDVQFAEPLIDENRKYYNLDSLGEKHLNKKKVKTEIDKECERCGWEGDSRKYLWRMSANLVGPYAKGDVRLTYDVFQKQVSVLQEQNLMEVFNLECNLIPLYLQMRKIGVRVDIEKLNKLKIEYYQNIEQLQIEINNLVGFEINVNSSSDLKFAFDMSNIEYFNTEKGNPSFDTEYLSGVAEDYELANKILMLRQTMKMKSNFLNGLEKFIIGDRIHGQIHPLKADAYGTVTGRMSYVQPALQTIPSKIEKFKKDLRGLFIPEEGQDWFKGDESQEEVRILAHYAMGEGADTIRKMFCNDPNIDFHQMCANMIGQPNNRKKAKGITLGTMYGMGKDKMARQLKVSLEEGTAFRDMYYERMPFLKNTFSTAAKTCKQRGYVKTILGRRRRIKDKNFCYKALNAIIQGTAGDILKKASLDCWNAGIFNVLTPHLFVHDELDGSIPRTKEGQEALKELKWHFENCIKLKVPLVFELSQGANWGEC